MNMMNPMGKKCKECGGEMFDGQFFIQDGNSVAIRNPGDGPYCARCYQKKKYPQRKDSLKSLQKMKERDREEGTKVVKVNDERTRMNPTGGGKRGV